MSQTDPRKGSFDVRGKYADQAYPPRTKDVGKLEFSIPESQLFEEEVAHGNDKMFPDLSSPVNEVLDDLDVSLD